MFALSPLQAVILVAGGTSNGRLSPTLAEG